MGSLHPPAAHQLEDFPTRTNLRAAARGRPVTHLFQTSSLCPLFFSRFFTMPRPIIPATSATIRRSASALCPHKPKDESHVLPMQMQTAKIADDIVAGT